ncbi:MAG: hypothetical protein IPH00_14015 [Flavobacteriales bacterium]|nr:hypothetical protein [Flavobacteriales bacterium]MBK7247208.1 hypothetical protein [Flavobacteriales bacterium]QQS71643.1 MAG: hypothetical protein IPP95_10650 [Flavobacteriales bacterium]
MRTLLLAGLATLLASPSGAQVPLTLDTSFRCTPVTYPPGLSDALPLADGSVVITGWFGLTTNYFSSWMVKLLPVGDLDVFWGINGGGISILLVRTSILPETAFHQGISKRPGNWIMGSDPPL